MRYLIKLCGNPSAVDMPTWDKSFTEGKGGTYLLDAFPKSQAAGDASDLYKRQKKFIDHRRENRKEFRKKRNLDNDLNR